MLLIFVRQIVLTAVVALQALDAGTWGEKIVATGILVSQGAGINLSSTSTRAEYNSVHATSVEDYVKLAPTEIRLLRLHHPSLVMWSVHVFRKSVRRLSISRGKLSQKSIKHLSNLANCEELTLFEVPIEDADFRLICNSLPLRRLAMQAQLLSPSAISEISKLQNLEDLKLWRSRIDVQGAAAISRCANLKSLVISSPTAGDAELASLHSLNKLVELSLSGTQITDGSAAWIAKLSTLKKLAVSRTLMTVSGVSQFRSLGQLERLSAYELKASPRTEMDFAGWSRDLKELDLTNTDLGDGGLRGIGLLSNLEKVYLGGTKIGDDDIRQLKGLRHLTELQVFELHLTDRSLKEVIPTLTSLVELTADETDISDESVKTLCDHPSLQVITVRKTNITEKGADRLMWHFRLSPGFWLPRE